MSQDNQDESLVRLISNILSGLANLMLGSVIDGCLSQVLASLSMRLV